MFLFCLLAKYNFNSNKVITKTPLCPLHSWQLCRSRGLGTTVITLVARLLRKLWREINEQTSVSPRRQTKRLSFHPSRQYAERDQTDGEKLQRRGTDYFIKNFIKYITTSCFSFEKAMVHP